MYASDVVYYTEDRGGRVLNRRMRRRFYACSSALDYDESYAEAKNMPPATTLQIILYLQKRVHVGGDRIFIKPVTRHEFEL